MTAKLSKFRGKMLIAMVLILVACGPLLAGDAAPAGLHIPQGQRVNFTHNMADGAGFRWDIQRYGSVEHGTNYAYSGGLYCQVNNSNVRSSASGWSNKTGDEIEIGPSSKSNLRVWRRVKVYKDQGLARWLDIFENTTSAPITVRVAIYTNTNYSIRNTETSSGAANFGEKDWAFVTTTSGGNSPPLLHMICGKKSKFRPSVRVQSNQIHVRWNLTVPAGKTAVLCYFEAQANSVDDHKKTMKGFRPQKALRDLPPAVRALIVNWSSGEFAGVELDRQEAADTVVVDADGPKHGQITNESYHIETLFGPVTLVAKDVVGMAAGVRGGTVRFVLSDGQIVSASVPEDKIVLKIPTGGELRIPFDRITRWSYRISKERPETDIFKGPYVMLRTGDRLAFDPKALELSFRTRYGSMPLKAETLFRIDMDNPGNAVHRAYFLNGSHLGGFVEPRGIPLALRLGPVHTVQRDMISQFHFAAEEKPQSDSTHIVLTNEDEIYGVLDEKLIEMASEFGSIKVKPYNVKVMVFSRTHLGRAVMKLWDGSIVRGQIAAAVLTVTITDGPSMKISPAQLVSIVCMRSLPPDEVIAEARRLIGHLGAESYKDRQDATEKLVKMENIAPILREHLKASDPEVRQRIEEILERTGSKKDSPSAAEDIELRMFGEKM